MLPSSCDTLHAAHERVSEAVLKSRQAHTPVLGIYAGDGSPITHLDQVSDGDVLLVRTDGTADAWDDRLFVVLLFGMCPVLRASVSIVFPPRPLRARAWCVRLCLRDERTQRVHVLASVLSLSLYPLSLSVISVSVSLALSPHPSLSCSLSLALSRSAKRKTRRSHARACVQARVLSGP